MYHPALLQNVGTSPLGVLDRLNDTHQGDVAAHCGTKKMRKKINNGFCLKIIFLEPILLKLPAGSNFDRDIISHLRNTIIWLEYKKKKEENSQ